MVVVTTPFVGTASGEGWLSWDRVNVKIDESGAARLARDSTPTYVDSEPLATVPAPVVAVDVGLTPLGDVYALGRDYHTDRPGVYRYVPDAGTLWRVPCFDDSSADETPETVLSDPRAVCATADTLYVADGASDLHAVSIHTYQHRWVVTGATADSVALATDGERVFVLDGGTETDGSVWRVAADGSITVVRDGLAGARDLTIGPDGTLLILRVAEGSATVERIAPDGSEATTLGGIPLSAPNCLVAGDDGALLVGGTDPASGSTLARYRPEAERFESLSGIDIGWAALERRIDTDGTDDRYGVTEGTGELHRLNGVRLTRPHPASGAHEGHLLQRFDTGEPGSAWHRLALDRTLNGSATAVRVRYRATDAEHDSEPLEAITGIGSVRAGRLRTAGVTTLTDLARLSPEVVEAIVSSEGDSVDANSAASWIEVAHNRAPTWVELTPAGTDDALLGGAVGRYLHVRVELVGEPSVSPHLYAFRAYFARESYLEYLPAVYREDERSAAFLDRFLAAFETIFAGVETALDHDTRHLDPEGVPREGLTWLGEWIGLDVEAAWPETVARDLLARSPGFHRRRGTPAGLLDLVGTYLDRVVEGTMSTTIDGTGREGDDGTTPEYHLSLLEYPDLDVVNEPDARVPFERLLGGPGQFVVLVGASLDQEDERAVDRLVGGTTPAHTAGDVVHLRDRFRLDDHTFLGINAALTDPEFRVDRSALAVDTALTEREPNNQLTIRSRLDSDSWLSYQS